VTLPAEQYLFHEDLTLYFPGTIPTGNYNGNLAYNVHFNDVNATAVADTVLTHAAHIGDVSQSYFQFPIFYDIAFDSYTLASASTTVQFGNGLSMDVNAPGFPGGYQFSAADNFFGDNTVGINDTFTFHGRPRPLGGLSPNYGTAGQTATVTAVGSNIYPGVTELFYNGAHYLLNNSNSATIPSPACGFSIPVYLYNPPPGGGYSDPITFTFNNPTPQIGSLSPSSTDLNQTPTVTINGSGFTPCSTVNWNGLSPAVTYISPSQIQVQTPAANTATNTGPTTITVSNPTPGGGNSNGAILRLLAGPIY
jgi:hypothetical protein